MDEDGTVTLLIGSMSNGQGHETAYSQILHEWLDLPFDKIRIVQGDTDRGASGAGTGGSWSLPMGGGALARAVDRLIEIAEGRGRASDGASGLRAEAVFQHENYTFPYGTHVCEVEADPETGAVRIVAYTAVHNFGRVLNPLLLADRYTGGWPRGSAKPCWSTPSTMRKGSS